MTIIKKLLILLIKFYQKYLTVISFGSCRYHPSCSSYALMHFEHNNIFKAFFYSTIRICKCNPLFDGGFDYPLVKLELNNQKFTKLRVKYWLIPQGNNKYLIIRNWEKNKQDIYSNVN
jgi:putative membrane protein insertion efficiency factor